jgi:hypothetical protein
MCCEKSIADELQTITGGQIPVDVKMPFVQVNSGSPHR